MQPPDIVIEQTIKEANLGTCNKSKRGVSIWKEVTTIDNEKIFTIASAFNSPPNPFYCDNSELCKKNCANLAVHAEQRAIHRATSIKLNLYKSNMLHVKTINNKLVPSGKPNCIHCSKLIKEFGIPYIWLYHSDGWKQYTAIDFHQQTIKNTIC